MSYQDAKLEAQRVIKELLIKHPPGMVVMILRELKTLLRATKDLTIYKAVTLALLLAGSLQAQTQTFSSYGARGNNQTTVVTQLPNGIIYNSIGSGARGNSSGGVIALPGTAAALAVSPDGSVSPIVVPAQVNEDRPVGGADPIVLPPLPNRSEAQPTSAAEQEYNKLYNSFTAEARKQIAADWVSDTGRGRHEPTEIRDLLGYTRLWLRFHTGALKN